MLEHEGQAALFEMGEAVPDPADAVTHAEVEEPAAPEVPKAEKEQAQPPAPGKDDPAPAHSGKVVDFPPPVTRRPRKRKKDGQAEAVYRKGQGCQARQRSPVQGGQGRSQ